MPVRETLSVTIEGEDKVSDKFTKIERRIQRFERVTSNLFKRAGLGIGTFEDRIALVGRALKTTFFDIPNKVIGTFLGLLSKATVGVVGLATAITALSLNAVRGLQDASGTLRTLSAFSKLTEDQIVGGLQRIRTEAGATRDEARDVGFALGSAGIPGLQALEDSIDVIRVAKATRAEAGALAEFVGKALLNFPDQIQSSTEALQLLVATVDRGAGPAEQFGKALSSVIGSAAEIRQDFPISAALVAQLSQTFQSAEVAADRYREIVSAVIKNQDVLGASLVDLFRNDPAKFFEELKKVVPEGGLLEFFGSKQAAFAVSALQRNIDNLARSIDGVRNPVVTVDDVIQEFLGRLSTRFAQVREEIVTALESIGNGLAPTFSSALVSIRNFLRDSQGEIKAFAEEAGKKLREVGDFVVDAFRIVADSDLFAEGLGSAMRKAVSISLTVLQRTAGRFLPSITRLYGEIGLLSGKAFIQGFGAAIRGTDLGSSVGKALRKIGILGVEIGGVQTIRGEIEELEEELRGVEKRLDRGGILGAFQRGFSRFAMFNDLNEEAAELNKKLKSLRKSALEFGEDADVSFGLLRLDVEEALSRLSGTLSNDIKGLKGDFDDLGVVIDDALGEQKVSKLEELWQSLIRILQGATSVAGEAAARPAVDLGLSGSGIGEVADGASRSLALGRAQALVDQFNSSLSAGDILGRLSETGASWASALVAGAGEILRQSGGQSIEDFMAAVESALERRRTALLSIGQTFGSDNVSSFVELENALPRIAESLRQIRGEADALGSLSFEASFFTAVEELSASLDASTSSLSIMRRSGDALVNGLSSGFQQVAQSIRDGTFEAEDAFKTLFSSILDSFQQLLSDLAAESLANALLGGISGAAGGGGISGFFAGLIGAANGAIFPGGFQAFANGSPLVDRPTLGLIGEGKLNEAVVPLPDGRTIGVSFPGNPFDRLAESIESIRGGGGMNTGSVQPSRFFGHIDTAPREVHHHHHETNLTIKALDGADVLRVISTPPVREFLRSEQKSNNATVLSLSRGSRRSGV